jgi:DNA repair protein RecO (recombination protein O)
VAAEKAKALVLRTADWSDTSRIATLWTREFGKVRVLAKGGRRLKSNFESALDLLTVCSIVVLRKSSGSLDLLTEARVLQRFGRLRSDLPALYAAYYVAELLGDWTEDYDPHPILFDEALATLETLGTSLPGQQQPATGLRLARFELVLLRELGYSPVLEACAICQTPVGGMLSRPEPQSTGTGEGLGRESMARGLSFSPAAGGIVCPTCQGRYRDRRSLAPEAWEALRTLQESGEAWQRAWSPAARKDVRHLLGDYVTYLLGHRPRLLPYLGS